LLLPHGILVVELRDVVVGLSLLISGFFLEHLQVLLVAALLLAYLLLVVLDCRVVALL
jgi:hypothetical protein